MAMALDEGDWLSWSERLPYKQEVPCSSRGSPTTLASHELCSAFYFGRSPLSLSRHHTSQAATRGDRWTLALL